MKKKKEEINNNSNPPLKRPIEGPYSTDFMNHDTLYATEDSLRKLIARMTNEVLADETIIHANECFVRKGIYISTVKKWRAKYPFFQEGYEGIKDILGMRRERAMLLYNPSKHEIVLPHYLEEYKEQRDLSLKSEEQKTSNVFNVTMPKIEI